jgi:hypothetical protein
LEVFSEDESAIAMRAIVDEMMTINVITSQGLDKIKKLPTQNQDVRVRADSEGNQYIGIVELWVSVKGSTKTHKEIFHLVRSVASGVIGGPEVIIGSNSRVKVVMDRNDVTLIDLAPSITSR